MLIQLYWRILCWLKVVEELCERNAVDDKYEARDILLKISYQIW